MFSAYFSGLFIGAGLICAIGAQNTYVLIQAIRRNHALPVALTCAFLDLVLIAAGVLGMGKVVSQSPLFGVLACLGGIIFLLVFGWNSLKRARSNQALGTDYKDEGQSLKKALLTTLAISLLNPHVYLDTVVMLGMISTNYGDEGRYIFGLGAASASFIWFLTLGLAGQAISPLFKKPSTWRILYLLVTTTVWLIAFGLLWELYSTLWPAYKAAG